MNLDTFLLILHAYPIVLTRHGQADLMILHCFLCSNTCKLVYLKKSYIVGTYHKLSSTTYNLAIYNYCISYLHKISEESPDLCGTESDPH